MVEYQIQRDHGKRLQQIEWGKIRFIYSLIQYKVEIENCKVCNVFSVKSPATSQRLEFA